MQSKILTEHIFIYNDVALGKKERPIITIKRIVYKKVAITGNGRDPPVVIETEIRLQSYKPCLCRTII